MNKPITKKEWMEYLEKTWDAAQEEALAQLEQKPVPWESFFKRYCPWLAQPEQGPVAWEDVLGAIARGWTHDDNKHKTMDVQLAVAIAKEIQDMVIAPPQRKPLTDEQIAETLGFGEHTTATTRAILTHAARAIEAAHGITGEKNG